MSDRIAITALLALLLAGETAASAAPLGDPMRPYYLGTSRTVTEAKTAWQVQSILISPERRIAVVNGKSLAVGDSIGNATVTAIEPYVVTIEHQGKQTQLLLTPKSVKTQAETP